MIALIGDRWTLLIVRDLFKGKKRYNEFLEDGERIPTNILANRLKVMEKAAIIERKFRTNARRVANML